MEQMILLQSLIIRKYWLPVLLHFLKRSTHVPVSEEIEYKSVIFRPSKGLISYGADSAELTKNEMQILSVLLKNAGKIVSRDEFMDELWQSDEFVDDNTLTVNVNRLRKKLDL